MSNFKSRKSEVKNQKLIVITAGGTGGHMFPADALAEQLKEKANIYLVTDPRGMKNYKGALLSFPHTVLPAASTGYKNVFGKIAALFKLGFSFIRAVFLLLKLKPAGVVGFGGYAAAPTVAAAVFLRIPIVLHEQNAVVGKGNKLFLRYARKLAVSFKYTRYAPKGKSVLAGMPIRKEISALAKKKKRFDHPTLTLLVLGGSQGASILTQVVPQALADLPVSLKKRLSVIQQVKKEDVKKTESFYRKNGVKAKIAPFFTDMPKLLAKADFFIGRAGASTLFENYAARLPALYVPHQSLNGHQAENALHAEEEGAAVMLLPSVFTPENLLRELTKALSNGRVLQKMSDAAGALAQPDAAQHLFDLVIKEFGV